MARLKDIDWNLSKQTNADRTFSTHSGGDCRDDRILATLMDIRDELKHLNALLGCPQFIGFPHTLKAIQRNTAKKRRQA